jgi:hypothetical protein
MLQLEELFQTACERTADLNNLILEQLWTRVGHTDGRFYYLNNKTGRTQWTAPYRERTFRSSDIEMEVFVSMILQYDLLASRYVTIVLMLNNISSLPLPRRLMSQSSLGVLPLISTGSVA